MTLVSLAAAAPQRQARTSSPRLAENYAKWLDEQVVYIITDEERKDFLKLKTDVERDSFIEEFWEIRNPLRGSKQNPFKEEHYRRLEYANQNFGRESNTPGWKTDMGHTYILFGKPVSRAPFKGYGQIYPLELWFYQNTSTSPSLPPFFYVLFFVPEDIGDYRFYHPIIDGPMKLVRGSQFRTNRDVYQFLKPLGGDLAHAILSPIPSEPIDNQDFNPSMSGEMLVGKIQNLANDSFEVQRIHELRYLRERVKSWLLVMQEKPLDIIPFVVSDSGGQYWLDYGVWVDDEKLGRAHPDGKQWIVNSSFRLLTEKGDLIVEDGEERSYPAFDGSAGDRKFRPFLLANRIPLVPGKYKLEVRFDNREASRTYKGERVVEISEPKPVTMPGVLLAATVQPAAKPNADTPFQYFGVQFLPAAEKRLSTAMPLRLLFQVHTSTGDARNYEVEYLLAHAQDRNIRRSFVDKIAPSEFQNGALLKSKTIPVTGLEPGDYRLVLSLRAEGSPEVLNSSTLVFKLEAEQPLPRLDFASTARTASNPGVAAYIRALECVAQKNDEKAAEYFRQSLDQNPSNAFALRSLARLYFGARQFNRVSELYRRYGIAAFKDTPEGLAQAALSFWQTGNKETAQEILKAADKYFPKDTLLIAAAKKIGEPVPKTSAH